MASAAGAGTEDAGFAEREASVEMINVTQIFRSGPFWSRRDNVAVHDVSLRLSPEPALITAVAGESGSGKTTLGRILLGFQRPTGGSVVYRGEDIHSLNRAQRKVFRREVQAVFQDPYSVYNPFYKVDHIFAMAIKRFNLANSADEARHIVEQAVSAVGLRPAETLGRYPHQLSGGQRQRVMVARSLLLRPRLIVADEPVSMVDASLRATILETLRAINNDLGISILYITHDLTTAYQVADNMLIMYSGHVVEAGEVEKVINDPKHPYTQLLMRSIPMPDPSQRWAQGSPGADAPFAGVAVNSAMCPFVDRCPEAVDECLSALPSVYRADDHRVCRCNLVKDSDVIENVRISDYFRER